MRWMNSINRVKNGSGMSVEQGRMIMHERCESSSECMSNVAALTILGGGSRTSDVTRGSDQVWGGRRSVSHMK